MYEYLIKFSYENGRVKSATFCGESEGEAIENFENYADGFDQFLEFISIEETVEADEAF